MMVNDMPKDLQEDLENTHRADFQRWKSKPEMRVLLSMLPKTSPENLFEILFQSTFEAGTQSGLHASMKILVSSLIEKKEVQESQVASSQTLN